MNQKEPKFYLNFAPSGRGINLYRLNSTKPRQANKQQDIMTKGKDIKADPEMIKRLLKEAEFCFGRQLHSPRDFMEFCYALEDELEQSLSLSTVKRLWGYVNCEYQPRLSTLSLLARYVGYRDWLDFADNMRPVSQIESSFMSGKSIMSDDLSAGDEVIFSWAPNRRCHAMYIGGDCFRVIDSHNSKIEKNDTFHTTLLAVGHPMHATNIVKTDGQIHNFYVAGKQKGLASVAVRKKGATGFSPIK